MKKIVLLIVLIIAFASTANAFDVTFKNTTDKVLNYEMYWLACDWKGFPSKVAMLGGQLYPGKTTLFSNDYKPGPYIITWDSPSGYGYEFDKEYYFEVKRKENIIISKPNSKVIVK